MVPIFNPELIRLTPRIFLNLRDHADLDKSIECCGLLGGRRLRKEVLVESTEPLVNALASPRLFEAEPASQFRAIRKFRDLGCDWIGIYHSHPSSGPVPSQHDLDRHQGGGMVDFILGKSTDPAKGWVLRAWDLAMGKPKLLPITLDGSFDLIYELELDSISV